MYVPKGWSEAQVVEVIDQVVRMMAPRFVFGVYSVEDIRQEAWGYAIEAMPRYDNVRPLPNFIQSHIHNRLCNLLRDKVRRDDAPCKGCHQGNSCVPDGPCEAYKVWRERQDAKASREMPGHLGEADNEVVDREGEEVTVQKELLRKIDLRLPSSMRADYLRMQAGIKLGPKREAAILAKVKEILYGD